MPTPPPDRMPLFVGALAFISLALLAAFFLLYGSDLFGFVGTIRSWMNGEGPHP